MDSRRPRESGMVNRDCPHCDASGTLERDEQQRHWTCSCCGRTCDHPRMPGEDVAGTTGGEPYDY